MFDNGWEITTDQDLILLDEERMRIIGSNLPT